MIKGDREKIESELAKICEDIQISEYHRYLAELATGDKRKDTTDKSLDAYKAAPVITVTEFPPTDLIRPELALNFSVFYTEYSTAPTAPATSPMRAGHPVRRKLQRLAARHEDT
ncbi:14-3-3 domain containing protein [Russula decolorans]